jgi:hypothetical protein
LYKFAKLFKVLQNFCRGEIQKLFLLYGNQNQPFHSNLTFTDFKGPITHSLAQNFQDLNILACFRGSKTFPKIKCKLKNSK